MKKTLSGLLLLLLVFSVSAQTPRQGTAPSQPKDSRARKKLVETARMQDGREIHLYDDMTYQIATLVASSPTVDRSAAAADVIAMSLSAMIRAKRHLAKQVQITAVEDLKLTKLMLALNDGSQAFHKKLKASRTINANNQADIIKLLSGLESAVSDLNKNGVLHVENEDARDELSTFIGIMEAAIAIVR